MRRTALFLLAILAPSCGGTSAVLFTGRDVFDGSGRFSVVGKTDEDRIYVADLVLGVGVKLPYAEDWEFQPTRQKPISGRSGSLLAYVTVQSFDPGRPVEEESFLRDEYLKNIRENHDGRGVPFADVALRKHGSHFVLEHSDEGTLPNGTRFKQYHFWSFRQLPDGVIYEAHLSTNHPGEPERAELCENFRKILGGEFVVRPPASK